MPCTGLSITTSPAISCLDFLLEWNISGGTPTVKITNNSTVVDPTKLQWWFYIVAPSGEAIYGINLDGVFFPAPDEDGVPWTSKTVELPTPFGNAPCGQIEFSANIPYVVKVFVRDTDSPSELFSYSKNTRIVRPNGNTVNSCGYFGAAKVSMKVDCARKTVMCFDGTNLAYNDILEPSVVTNKWTVVYPMSNDSVSTRTAEDVPNANFPTSVNSKAYVLYFDETCTYDYGNGITVIVKYKLREKDGISLGLTFAINCDTNLCRLQCQMNAFYQRSKSQCGDLQNARLESQMVRLNWLFSQILTGIFQPLCGIDVPALMEEMKQLGKFDDNCDCGCDDCGDNFGFSNPTGTGGASGDIPNLQQVSDVGNVTSKLLVSGSNGGKRSQIGNQKIEVWDTTEVLALMGLLSGIPGVGSMGLHALGSGTVYIAAPTATNTYILRLPNDQGGAGQVMVNDGAGNMSWVATPLNPNLQAVTVIGKSTDQGIKIINNGLIFDRSSGVESIMYPENGIGSPVIWLLPNLTSGTGVIATKDNPNVWSALQSFGAGFFKLLGSGSGGITLVAADITTDYSLKFPAAQGGANSYLKNDGGGNLSWVTSVGNLQSVTDGAGNNVTTNDMVSGANAGNNMLMSGTKTGLRSGGTTDIIYFQNVAGAPHLKTKQAASAFGVDLVTPTISSGGDRVIQWPSRASGILAIQGNNVVMSYNTGSSPELAAGPGATLVFDSNSDGNKGSFTLTTTTVGGVTGNIVRFGYIDGTIGTTPIPQIYPMNAAARALTIDQAFVSSATDGAWVIGNTTALADATQYKWSYIIQR